MDRPTWTVGVIHRTPNECSGAELPESARRIMLEQGHAKAGTAIPRQGDVIRYGMELRGVLIDIRVGRVSISISL